MDSDIERKVGIYWDLNTCHSNDIQLLAQKIRELYVKRDFETEFWCSTVEDIYNREELEDKHNIRTVRLSKTQELNKFLIERIENHVNECLINNSRPVVVLITGDNCLAKVLYRIGSSVEKVVIYGQNLKQELIFLSDRYLPFIDLELMVINNNILTAISIPEVSIDLKQNGNPSKHQYKHRKVKNKWLSLNCFGRKTKKPYEKLIRELRGESCVESNNNSTKSGEKSIFSGIYFYYFIYSPFVLFVTTLLAHFTTNAIFKHLCNLLFALFTKNSINYEEIDLNMNSNNLSSVVFGSEQVNHLKNTSKKQRNIAGVCGLTNLGNTCFMNSAIQCLSNIQIFTQFSLNNKHDFKTQTNKSEPKLLFNYYCNLIEKLWSAEYRTVSPEDLRLEVSKNFLQFGYHLQNDCSEFLTLILDRFHEELKQLNGQNNEINDEIISYKCFSDYLKANNTFIANNFHGFQRFLLSCDCGQTLLESFNPFSVLNIPQMNHKTNNNYKLKVYFMPLSKKDSDSHINSYELNFFSDKIYINDILSQFIELFCEQSWTQLSQNDLIVAQIRDYHVIKINEKDDFFIVNEIIGDIFIYESDPKFDKHLFITLGYESVDCFSPFGIPLMINVNDSSFESINSAFRSKFADFMIETEMEIRKCEKFNKQLKSVYYLICYGEKCIPFNYYSHDYNLQNNHLLWVIIPQSLKQLYKMPQIQHLISNFTHIDLNLTINVNLYDSIDYYLTNKKFLENDRIFCSKCNSNQVPNEKFDIIHAPNVLLIQLKSNTSYFQQNINFNFDFPLKLNLNNYVMNGTENDKTLIYDLIAISNYSGSDFSGHYTTYAKNYINNKWYYFNDSFVEEISEQLIFTKKAYLLVYMKSDLNCSLTV